MKISFALYKLHAALALASFASASNSFQGDGATEWKENIVGGTEATPGRYSYTVALTYYGSQFCGGSLISPDTVLTAAHCMGYTSFDVVINRHDLTTSAGESIPKSKEIIHPDYDTDTEDNDYALVFLDRATTENVVFVKLNQDELFPSGGATSRAMGWGDTSDGGSSSNVLREVDLPIITNQECDQKYPQYPIYDFNICTFLPGKDSCQGDSGGPLIMPGASANEDKLIGIVSWGIGCATIEYPGVYSRVSNQINWIKETVCENSQYPPSDLCTSATPVPTAQPSTKVPTATNACSAITSEQDCRSNGCRWRPVLGTCMASRGKAGKRKIGNA
jgi:trypsin